MKPEDTIALRDFVNLDTEAVPFAYTSDNSYIQFIKARQRLEVESRTLLEDLENDLTLSGTNLSDNTNINMLNRNYNLNCSNLSTHTDTESFISEMNVVNNEINNSNISDDDDDDNDEIATIPSVRTITSSITDYPQPVKIDNWIEKDNNNVNGDDNYEENISDYVPTFY